MIHIEGDPELPTAGQLAAHSVNEFLLTVSKRGVSMFLPDFPEFGDALVHMANIQLGREGIDFTVIQPPKRYGSGPSLTAALATNYMRSEGYRVGPFNRRKITEMARIVIEQ